MEAKDYSRLKDIETKASGDVEKAKGLARHMTALIKDPAKALRRYEAAEMVFGEDHPVTQIFRHRRLVLIGRAVEMDSDIVVLERGPKVRVPRTPKAAPMPVGDTSSLGSALGESKGGILKEDDKGFTPIVKGIVGSFCELWKLWTGELITIGTDTPADLKTIANFSMDGEFKFGGELIDWASSSNTGAFSKYGTPTGNYTYQ